jgi:hypothetical protein
MVGISRNVNALICAAFIARNGINLPNLVRRHRLQSTVHQQHLIELQISLGHTHGNQAEKEKTKDTFSHVTERLFCCILGLKPTLFQWKRI